MQEAPDHPSRIRRALRSPWTTLGFAPTLFLYLGYQFLIPNDCHTRTLFPYRYTNCVHWVCGAVVAKTATGEAAEADAWMAWSAGDDRGYHIDDERTVKSFIDRCSEYPQAAYSVAWRPVIDRSGFWMPTRITADVRRHTRTIPWIVARNSGHVEYNPDPLDPSDAEAVLEAARPALLAECIARWSDDPGDIRLRALLAHDFRATDIIWSGYLHNTLALVGIGAFLWTAPNLRRLTLPGHDKRRLARNLCPRCAYDRSATLNTRCPECGWEPPPPSP